MIASLPTPTRRRLLCAAATTFVPFLRAGQSAGKSLLGIFPIAQTPFTTSDKLDLDSLRKQVDFLDRGGVHGIVWPQLASEWMTLTEAERMSGAEALIDAGKKARRRW